METGAFSLVLAESLTATGASLTAVTSMVRDAKSLNPMPFETE